MPSAAIAALRSAPSLRRIERFKASPERTQTGLLRRLLTTAEDTEWGKRFGFRDLSRATQVKRAFASQVPEHDHSKIQEDVARMRAGARDVSWPGRIPYFAVSSGTASVGKILPLSAEMLRHNRDFSLATALVYTAATGRLRIWGGRLLSIPGRVERDAAKPDVWIGEVSGLMYLFAPAFVRYGYQAVPREVLFMPHWEAKLDAIVERARTRDIRAIAMVPSWAPVLFDKLIARHNEATGASASTVGEIWPRLQVFFSGGVALSSYEALLAESIGLPDMHFIESYGASEGVFAFQDHPNDDDMLLHLDNGVYFEFVPMDDRSTRLDIGQVETGVRYRMLVSTCSGLWAYSVGDVVVFTSLHPPRIRVAGRTAEMLDQFGEAVYGDEAMRALDSACSATGCRALDYHVAPLEEKRPPGHQWLIEFLDPPTDSDAFADALDAYLRRVNRHYTIRREAGAFAPPSVVALPPGTFRSWMQATRDRVGAQSKVPRMRDDRSIANAVLETAETIPKSFT